MITARYKWELDTVQEGFALHMRTQPALRVLFMVPLAIVGFGIYKLFTDRQPLAEGIPPILIGIIFLFGLRPFMRWQFRRAARANPAYGQEIVWTFDAEQIAVVGGDASATFTWKTLQSATVSSAGLLLYPQKNLFHWVPMSAFGSAADYETVRTYLAGSGIRVRAA